MFQTFLRSGDVFAFSMRVKKAFSWILFEMLVAVGLVGFMAGRIEAAAASRIRYINMHGHAVTKLGRGCIEPGWEGVAALLSSCCSLLGRKI